VADHQIGSGSGSDDPPLREISTAEGKRFFLLTHQQKTRLS
jgi:hypothetical protein